MGPGNGRIEDKAKLLFRGPDDAPLQQCRSVVWRCCCKKKTRPQTRQGFSKRFSDFLF
jgi:hypothetical protein